VVAVSLDLALESIMDGLYRNPYGFRYVENDHIKIRYAITKRVGDIPPLCVYFRIDDNNDVELLHVEEHLVY
jgi:hypothetical protein